MVNARTLVLAGLLACRAEPEDAWDRDPAPGLEPEVSVAALGEMQAAGIDADPPGAAFVDAIDVTLTTTVAGARIWYTLDGSPPSGASAEYTGPLTLEESAELRAIAEVDGSTVAAISRTFLRLDPSADGFSSDLPLIVLWSTSPAPEVKDGVYVPSTLTTFEPAPRERVSLPSAATTSVRAGIRIRGSTSAGLPKRPYRVETWDPAERDGVDLDVPLLGMPPDGDWVFIAPLRFDRAFVRDALMHQLSRDLGRYGVRTRFAEVFVTDRGQAVAMDDYVGIYVVAERIERGRDRLDIARLEPSHVDWPEVSGGFIFKDDRLGPGESGLFAGTAGGAFRFDHPFVMVSPGEFDLAPEQRDYLVGALDELGEALASPGRVHPVSGRHYGELIDIDAWIDHHILNVFAKNPDAFRLSGFYHKDRQSPIAAGPIWDFDRSMGSLDARTLNPTWWDESHEEATYTPVFEYGFWSGLFADPAFRDRYWARWADVLANELSVAAMHGHVDAMADRLQEAAPRNYAVWTAYPPRGGSLTSEIELLKDWIAQRHAWIAGCLAMPEPRDCVGY